MYRNYFKKLFFVLLSIDMSYANSLTDISVNCPKNKKCIYLNDNNNIKIKRNLILTEGEYKLKVVKEQDEYILYIDMLKVFHGTRFINNNEVVIDKKLGLMWQDNVHSRVKTKNWRQSAKYCAKLSLLGFKDWRLPAYEELLTIVDYSRKSEAIIPEFKNVKKSRYWSYSPYLSDNRRAWFISFKDGETGNYSKSKKHYVRCVRNK